MNGRLVLGLLGAGAVIGGAVWWSHRTATPRRRKAPARLSGARRHKGGGRLGSVKPFDNLNDFTDRIDEIKERPGPTKALVDKIKATAEQMAEDGEGFGSDAVYISDVAAKMGTRPSRIAEALLIGANQGWITVTRSDVAIHPDKQAASEVVRPGGGAHNTVHLIRVEPARVAWAEDIPVAPRKTRPMSDFFKKEPEPPRERKRRVGADPAPRRARRVEPEDMGDGPTVAQLTALLRDQRDVNDPHGVAIIEAAMAPSDDDLYDFDDKPITRAQARSKAKAILRKNPIEPMRWFNAAVAKGADRDEWLAIADAVEATIEPGDVSDKAARVRDARDRAKRA